MNRNLDGIYFRIERNGKDTDLKTDKWVFDIELGERIR